MTAGYLASRCLIGLAAWVTYLGLVGQFEPAEIAAGGVFAAATLALWVHLELEHGRPYRFRARWLVQALTLPWKVLQDCIRVFGALLAHVFTGRPLAGRFEVLPWPPGEPDEEMAARLAIATIGTCMAPNVYVVGVDAASRRILIHELVPHEQPPEEKLWWPR